MALLPRLDLRQTQSLVITPQLQQAIKLLQLSAVELVDYVEQELESNPLLENDDTGEGSALSESAGNADDRADGEVSVIDAVDGQDERPLDVETSLADNDAGLADSGETSFDTHSADTWGEGGYS